MQLIPSDIWATYSAVLKKRAIPVTRHADYRKWLRYFLDFRSKYPLPTSRAEQVRLFIQKLHEKRQTPEQQKQAAHALSLYFETLRKMDNKTPPPQINTEKTVKATSPSTPRSESSRRVASTFIKGESSNNLSRAEAAARSSSQLIDSGDLSQASISPLSAGKRYNELIINY